MDLVLLQIHIDSIRVRSHRRSLVLVRSVSTHRSTASSHEPDWSTCLPFKSRHGVCLFLLAVPVLAVFFYSIGGLLDLLASCYCLRGDEVDVGAVRMLVSLSLNKKGFMRHTCIAPARFS